jgi:type I restriction enzyme R subunit
VDLIATGTDIKPIEIVMFMRSVKSRVLFEQMKGRGVRVINPGELRAVTPDARAKTQQCDAEDRKRVQEASGGPSLATIVAGLIHAVDDDVQEQAARNMFQLGPDAEPAEEQIRKASEPLKWEAIHTLMSRPALRKLILDLRHKFEQVVDEVSKDELLHEETGHSQEARDKAQALVQSFEQYLEEHKNELDALQFFYSLPAPEASAVRGHQGARRCHLVAAAAVDAGEALACL